MHARGVAIAFLFRPQTIAVAVPVNVLRSWYLPSQKSELSPSLLILRSMSRRRSYFAIGAALLGCQADAFAGSSIGQATCTCMSCITGSRLYVGGSIDPAEDRGQSSLKLDDPKGSENADLLPAKESNADRDFPLSALWSTLTGTGGGPPLQVDDTNLLLYDVFLLLNLSASISFWVVHRMNFMFIAESLNEGALLSICWMLSGLANGSFLYSAVDGHWDPSGKDADKGGPKAAGLLGLSTFIGTSSIRILIALAVAVAQHRPVGSGGEALIPLEILVGLILMSSWRALHSANTPRL